MQHLFTTMGQSVMKKKQPRYIFDGVRQRVCIKDNAEGFTAQLYAINWLCCVSNKCKNRTLFYMIRFVVCSPISTTRSFSQPTHSRSPLRVQCYSRLLINLLWISSHVCIHGNGLADSLATFALHRDIIVSVKLSFWDLRTVVTCYVTKLVALTRKTTRQTSFNKLVPT